MVYIRLYGSRDVIIAHAQPPLSAHNGLRINTATRMRTYMRRLARARASPSATALRFERSRICVYSKMAWK